MRGAAGSRGGDTRGAIGSQRGDVGGAIDPEEETREAPLDSKEEAEDLAGLAVGWMASEGPVVPARRKLIISGNIPPHNVIAHVESTGARRHGRGSAPQSILPTIEEVDKESDEDRASVCDGEGSMISKRKVEIPTPIERDMSPKK